MKKETLVLTYSLLRECDWDLKDDKVIVLNGIEICEQDDLFEFLDYNMSSDYEFCFDYYSSLSDIKGKGLGLEILDLVDYYLDTQEYDKYLDDNSISEETMYKFIEEY